MTLPVATAILLVDDSPTKRLALKAVLLPLGHTIVEADSGRAALRCLMAQDFAVILLDVCMPGLDGYETAALIRQRARSEMTPIIFITAHASDELSRSDRCAEGAVDFIFAPVAPEELRAKVTVFANLFSRAEALASQAREVQACANDLRLLTDAAPIGIFRTDTENRYVYTNPMWSEITGVAADEAAGQALDALLGQECAPENLASGRRFELQRKGTDSRILHVIASPVERSDGGTGGWVGTLADVTAEAGAEAAVSAARDEATEASRLKSDFLANMSHEIRTPMNGVIGMTDLLLETELDDRQRDYAQTVRYSGDALMTIINDILDFSKVEAGRVEVERIEFELQTVVEDVGHLLAGPAQAKGVELVMVVDRTVPPVVWGDPGRVRQVLTNLVGNAIKFTHTGEIVVRVTATEAEEDETLVRFEVSDTGDGIAADKLDLIFQPFAQADTSTSRKYGGTGLGLAISSQLVALMDGECGVSSELGVGSDFWFTVRVHPQTGQPELTVPVPGEGLAGVDVLVIAKSASLRSGLSSYLAEWGMAVNTAQSGPAGLAALRLASAENQPFALVLLDCELPRIGGRELKYAIASEPGLDPRIVLMKDLGGPDEPAASGVAASLSKPIRRKELLRCLRIALGLHAAPAPTEAVPSGEGVRGHGRLLLAEDNPINRKVALAMLSGAGYCVDTVADGAEAVEAVAERPYDAILMDCQMPELDGYEATAAIRALEGAGRRTPIIALTAGAHLADRDRCIAEGMDSYLAKPVDKQALLALVASALKDGDVHGLGYEPTIDPVVFDELRELGKPLERELLTDLVEQFARESEPLIVSMRDAVDAGDVRAVGRCAYALKGCCGQLGGRRLARSCDRLERKASAGYLGNGRTDLDEIEVDYEDLRRALTQHLSCVDLRAPAAAVVSPARADPAGR